MERRWYRIAIKCGELVNKINVNLYTQEYELIRIICQHSTNSDGKPFLEIVWDKQANEEEYIQTNGKI